METRPLFRKAALDKLSSPDQLDHLLTITAPRDWWLLLAVALFVGGVVLWGIFGTLEITTHAQGFLVERPNVFEAVLYVPLAEAVKIQPGMPVYLSVGGISTTTYGYLLGEVQDLVRSTEADTMLAYIKLMKSDNHFLWTHGIHTTIPLRGDMAIDGIIVRAELRPLEALFFDATR